MRSRVVRGTAAQENKMQTDADIAAAANPIRKVVTMLMDMQKKVTEEGKKEQDLYDKFMCYCNSNTGTLSEAITAAQAKIESTSAALKASEENKMQTEANLKEHQTSRSDAQATMAQAEELRKKEAAEFATTKSDLDTNIAAIFKAVAALEKGAAGTFLQTPAVGVLKRYIMEKANLQDGSREELLSFLSGAHTQGYSPAGGEVTGMLRQLGDEMKQSLSDATNQEDSSIKNFEELMAAKKKELDALQSQIEEEMTRVGQLGVSIAEMGNDIEDTQQSLTADQQLQSELANSCKTKSAEWEEIKKNRADELVALAETITALNDDEALELFKKTLPSASSSFVQMKDRTDSLRARALRLIRHTAALAKNPSLDLIALALRGKQVGFEKVIKMIDSMVESLHQEQVDDDAKLEYCNTQMDQTEDKVKGHEQSIADSETNIAQAEGDMATLAEEIKALEAGIKSLDKSVSDATEQRKMENSDVKALMASDSQAVEILNWAKNRLAKFYNPSLYVAPPKRELSEEGSAASFVQVRRHKTAEAPPPPPEAPGPFKKKGEESNAVLAMIDLLIKELDKEMQEAEVVEREAQADYEKTMADSASKRAADSKASTEKAAARASAEEALETERERHAGASKELMGAMQYMGALHSECDWLLKFHGTRKEARADEIDALKNAKAVLSGADFSLVQTAAARV